MDGVETYFDCELIKAVGEIFMARDQETFLILPDLHKQTQKNAK